MSKRFKDYRRFKVYTWRPDPQPLGGRAARRPRTTTAGRRAGPDQRAARPAPAAPRTSPGQKGPEPPLRSRRLPGPPPRNNPRLDRPPLPTLCRGPDVPLRPPARRPPQYCGLRLRADSKGLRCARLPERALRPAARRAAGRVLRRTEGAYCSHPRGAGLRARRSSPVGQEAGRRDPTPYETRLLVGSDVGRVHSRGADPLTWVRGARS